MCVHLHDYHYCHPASAATACTNYVRFGMCIFKCTAVTQRWFYAGRADIDIHNVSVCICVKIYSCLPFFVRYLTAWRVSVFSLCIILAPSTKSHILLCLVARWRNVIMGFSNNLSIELEELSCTSDSELQHFISLPVNQPCVGEDASNVWSLSDTLIICFCLIDSFTSPSTLQLRVECPLFISVGHLLEGNRAENAVLTEM